MYLYIFEDGDIKYRQDSEPTQEDFQACNGGMLQIVDVKTMRSYYEGTWEQLKEIIN